MKPAPLTNECHPAQTRSGTPLRLRLGFRFRYALPQSTPMVAMLNVHYSRIGDMEMADHLVTTPFVPLTTYRDATGNLCTRLLAPAGDFELATQAIIRDGGAPDPIFPAAFQHVVEGLPADTILYLLGSRYCDTDLLSELAWEIFGQTAPGWTRVQAICDFVHQHVRFGYEHASPTRTASQTLAEGRGVCRDFAHLAITLCRCMNIPARYCTGYLTDIGEPEPHPPGDFAAWMEVYLENDWRIFDPRNNTARIGRVLMARGRDAADVPLILSFGQNTLTDFRVWAEPTNVPTPCHPGAPAPNRSQIHATSDRPDDSNLCQTFYLPGAR